MAVQIPDPGTGNGQTGDNEYVFRKKVKDNFSDQKNAASRLVGTDARNVMEVGAGGWLGVATALATSTDEITTTNVYVAHAGSMGITSTHWGLHLQHNVTGYASQMEFRNSAFKFRTQEAGTWGLAHTVYHTGNTTKDSNGFLKGASPIVKVFADKVELNGEAEDQDVSYKKNGIGDYTITTQSGLSTDGWYIELPKDINGNPKVAVTLTETGGIISLKCYKRIFSMETFTFVPDLDEPLDIPDGRWIDLRLNEIPVEHEDDVQTEV